MIDSRTHKWPVEALEWLKANYARASIEDLVKHMNSPIVNIRSIANYYGLRRDTVWLKNEKKKQRYMLNKNKQSVENADTIPSDAVIRRIHSGMITVVGNVLTHRGI